MRKLIVVAIMILFSACGKNEAVRSVGNNPPPNYPPNQGPYNQAPMPPNGGYYPPPGGGGYPAGGPPPYFQPVMPPQMPPQYTPFLPIDYYFRQRPQLVNVYVNIWNDWRTYANYYGYNQYDFNGFWFDYCQTNWVGGYYGDLYNYMNTNVYWWASPEVSYCDSGCDAGYFWQHYQGFDYGNLDNTYCQECYY
jgi:hypothetical protein